MRVYWDFKCLYLNVILHKGFVGRLDNYILSAKKSSCTVFVCISMDGPPRKLGGQLHFVRIAITWTSIILHFNRNLDMLIIIGCSQHCIICREHLN